MLFSLLPTIILLLVLEVGLRVYVSFKVERERGRALPPPVERSIYQQEDPVLGFSLRPGYEAGGIRVNTLGYRGAEVSPNRAGVFRVVALGDSTTFGLAGADCPYPFQLQRLFTDTQPNSAIEVINAGVEGYSSKYAIRFLDQKVRSLQPDLVTVYIGWNDLYGLSTMDPDGFARGDDSSARVRRLLDRFYLVQFWRKLIYLEAPRFLAKFRSTTVPIEATGYLEMVRGYTSRLERIISLIEELGARPVLMTLPTVLSEQMSPRALAMIHYPAWAQGDHRLLLSVVGAFNDSIRDVANKKNVILIDNARFIDAFGAEKERLFFDTLHMHCEGYALLAQNIRRELERQNIIANAVAHSGSRH